MRETSVALGFFDGVHTAHQKIVSQAVLFAEENGLFPVVLTFDKSPLEILSPEKVRYLTTNKEKSDLIKALGAETEFLPLTKEFLSMSPEEFVKNILVDRYKITHAVCGFNYRFGKNGSGDIDTLRELGGKYGFTVDVCNEITLDGNNVSSSNIRTLLKDGNIVTANKLLGHNFALYGKVCEGKHLGKTLGFPTANVFFPENSATPLCGVYKTLAEVDGIKMPAITNVGTNPTVGGEKMRSETYIPGFSKDIYGTEIRIEFIDFIRKERKFSTLDELKMQIKKDIDGGSL